jgi:lipopolysaccharide transport system permease protein
VATTIEAPPRRSAPPLRPGGSPREVHIIESRPPGTLARLLEVWHYRRLLRIFGGLYMRKMYANTWLGRLWIPLRPLLGLGLQVAVFGGLLHAPSDGVPYFLFLVAGLGAWQMLSVGWYLGTRSLQIQRRTLSRIHVPRLVPVIGSMATGLMWMSMYIGMLIAGVGYYLTAHHHLYVPIGIGLLEALAGVLLLFLLTLSLSLWTSVLGAQARDPRFIVRHVLHIWYYATPVIYPLSALPPKLATLAQLNPATAPLEMVRKGLYGIGSVRPAGLAITFAAILIVGYGGLRFFARSESTALDYL